MLMLLSCILLIVGKAEAEFESAGCSDEGCGIPCYLKPADDDCHYTEHDSCGGGSDAGDLDDQIRLLNNSLVRLQEKLIQKGIIPSGRSCPPLPQIDHGGVVYSDLLLSIGVIANFVCEENYSLHGRGRYECSSDNEWIDSNSEIIQQIPTCEESLIICDDLVPIPNGHVSYQIVDVAIVQPGDMVTYSCDPAYTLQGAQHRICLRNGSWSGTEPQCTAPTTNASRNSTQEESTNNGWEVAVGVVIAALVAVVAVIVIIAIILCTRRSRRTSSYLDLDNSSKTVDMMEPTNKRDPKEVIKETKDDKDTTKPVITLKAEQ